MSCLALAAMGMLRSIIVALPGLLSCFRLSLTIIKDVNRKWTTESTRDRVTQEVEPKKVVTEP